MRNNSLKIDILADEIVELLSSKEADVSEITKKLFNEFPSLSLSDAQKISVLIDLLTSKSRGDTVEIVSTTPVSFTTKNRKTYPVVEELLSSARKSIILTGYSISDHFTELLELIYLKSKQGVMVELFLNDYEEVKHLLSDINHNNKTFFKVFEYSGIDGDEMASLHAKTIIVDEERVLISSANLSYHGMVSNVEIGVLIKSNQKAKQVLDIFHELIRNRKFALVYKILK